MSSDDVVLARAAHRAAYAAPDLIAPLINSWRTAFEEDPAVQLDTSNRTVSELALCRRPRPSMWLIDVKEISTDLGIKLPLLVSFLRAAEAVERFGDAHATADDHDGRLMAARDVEDD